MALSALPVQPLSLGCAWMAAPVRTGEISEQLDRRLAEDEAMDTLVVRCRLSGLIGDDFAVITARHWAGISVGALQIAAVEHVAPIVDAVASAGLAPLLRRRNDRRQILARAMLADFV